MPITLDGTLGVGTPGITLAGGAITASANQLNNSSEDVNSENRIINGDFNVWQRGTSSTAQGYVAADRWRNNSIGGTVTQSRFNFGQGEFLATSLPRFGLRQTVSGQTLPSHFAGIEQRIEGVRSYAEQTITVLGWARRTSGSGNMSVQGSQFFGTGGAGISADAFTPVTLISLTGAWVPFAVTITVPSITAKTLGTDGNDYFALNFYTSLGSTYGTLGLQTIAVDLWGIHIRQGTWTAADASLYRPRDLGTEFSMCQRYYEVFPATSAINGLYVNAFLFTVSKRGQPQVNLVSGSLASGAFTANAYGIGQSTNSTGASNVVLGVDAEL